MEPLLAPPAVTREVLCPHSSVTEHLGGVVIVHALSALPLAPSSHSSLSFCTVSQGAGGRLTPALVQCPTPACVYFSHLLSSWLSLPTYTRVPLPQTSSFRFFLLHWLLPLFIFSAFVNLTQYCVCVYVYITHKEAVFLWTVVFLFLITVLSFVRPLVVQVGLELLILLLLSLLLGI